MKQLKFIILNIIFILLMLIACGNDKPPIINLPLLKLNKAEITADSSVRTKIIFFKSYRDWVVQKTDAEDWCNIEKRGTDSSVLTINEKHSFQSWETSIKLSS